MAKKTQKAEDKTEQLSDNHKLVVIFIAECEGGNCEDEIRKFIGEGCEQILKELKGLGIVVKAEDETLSLSPKKGWDYYVLVSA
jgi:hypothetical protein